MIHDERIMQYLDVNVWEVFLWIKMNSARTVTWYVQLNDKAIKDEILVISQALQRILRIEQTITHGMSINFTEGSWRTALQIINRISMQVRLMQFNSHALSLYKTIDVIAVTWKDVLVVLINYSSRVVKRTGKGLYITKYKVIHN